MGERLRAKTKKKLAVLGLLGRVWPSEKSHSQRFISNIMFLCLALANSYSLEVAIIAISQQPISQVWEVFRLVSSDFCSLNTPNPEEGQAVGRGMRSI